MSEKRHMELYGVVTRGDPSHDFWTRIGTGFQNKDGSWNLLFDYFPTEPNATIQMREPKPEQG